MKLHLGTLALALFLALPAAAQRYVYIPGNTPGLGPIDYIPFIGGDMRFLYLIKASDLGSKPFKITEIAFAPAWTELRKPFGHLQIRMSRTTASSLTSCFGDRLRSPVILLDTPYSWNALGNLWSPMPFQWSFVYDGSLNLVVELRYKGGVDHPLAVHTAQSFVRVYNNYPPNPYQAPCTSRAPEQTGPLTRFKVTESDMLVAPDHVRLGQGATLQLLGASPGHAYQFATALTQTPLPLGACRINLTPDDLFVVSVTVGPPFFVGYGGRIDQSGTASATIACPNDAGLVGVSMYHAAVTYDQLGLSGCTNTSGMEIRP